MNDKALELLGRLVNDGAWYGSAIELDQYSKHDDIDGKKMGEEATAILREAGWRECECGCGRLAPDGKLEAAHQKDYRAERA